MTQIIDALAEISDTYDALFVDLWGCIHNGVDPFETAVTAMQDYRIRGGTVIYVTNAPRHRASVALQLKKLGVAEDSYDDIATSGDSARAAMYRGAVGSKVYFIGQPHDQNFFDPLKLIENPVEITQVPLMEAEGIVCCGPVDPMAAEHREWCAGALAKLYTEMGGESLYFGKPHPPIYDLARRRLAALGKDVPDARILCIGDGVLTDIQGAQGEDLDSLFISGGLAAAETKTDRHPDPDLLHAYLQKEMVSPPYVIGKLR
jgi:ribonucleotide monophosphatase NagD (HAD superfamily)